MTVEGQVYIMCIYTGVYIYNLSATVSTDTFFVADFRSLKNWGCEQLTADGDFWRLALW